jgi:hypothetical protein
MQDVRDVVFRRKQLGLVLFDRLVAFTGGLFQALDVENDNLAAPVL